MEPMKDAVQVVGLAGRTSAAAIISPTVGPASPTVTHLGFTVTFICLFALLFLLIYVQLVLIFYYKHKRLSYQTAFLFLCLVWCALRTTLFAFYFRSAVATNNFSVVTFWVFFCGPTAIQFVTLALLVFYFAQVVLRANKQHHNTRLRLVLRLGLALAVVLFLATNVVCGVVIQRQRTVERRQPYEIITARVFISELLFLACGLTLGLCLYRLIRMRATTSTLESACPTACQLTATCALILLYISRAAYNLAVVAMASSAGAPSFNYSWINVTDLSEMKGVSYNVFGVVLFVWELVPTLIVVLLFLVRRPAKNLSVLDLTSRSFHSGTFLFDNPRRYDSDEEPLKSVMASHDYSGQRGDYHVLRSTHRFSPYGSFQASYVFSHRSHLKVVTAADGPSTSRGRGRGTSPAPRRPPCDSPLAGTHVATQAHRAVIITVHTQHRRQQHLRDHIPHSNPN